MSAADLMITTMPGASKDTMTSRDVADLLGARHDNVRRTIDRLVERGVIQSPPMEDFININGVAGKEYTLNERESYIVVAQLSPEFTAKLVDFWQKHRNTTPALPDFTNPAIAARAWADEVEKRQLADLRAESAEAAAIQSSQQLAIAAPKAEALDRLETAEGSMCITDAAKTLQIRQSELFTYMRQNGWLYRRVGTSHDVAYQDKLNAGLLEHKVNTINRNDGTEKVTTQVRVTAKGLARLARCFPPAIPRWPSHPHVWERVLPEGASPVIDSSKRGEALPDGSLALPLMGGGYTILPPASGRNVA